MAKEIEQIRANEEGWKEMVTYVGTRMYSSVRQDAIISENSKENIVKYPLKPSFAEKELRRLGVLEVYDTRAHLAKLSVVAHAINEKFHEAVRRIFEIDESSGVSKDGKLRYRAGPLKDLVRSKSKAENDYFSARFPTSSKVIDFVRGSLTFSSCKDCVEALRRLEKAVASKKTVLKEIGRVKNMFLEKRRKGESINSYADIKTNILVESGRRSMVCELQFLLKPMVKCKKDTHPIYEIMRTQTFRENIAKVRSLYTSSKEELLAIAMRQNEKELGRFMLNHPTFKLFEEHTAGGLSLIHYLAQSGNVKLMKLLLSSLSPKQNLKEVINMRGNAKKTPLFFAALHGQLDMAKVNGLFTAP